MAESSRQSSTECLKDPELSKNINCLDFDVSDRPRVLSKLLKKSIHHSGWPNWCSLFSSSGGPPPTLHIEFLLSISANYYPYLTTLELYEVGNRFDHCAYMIKKLRTMLHGYDKNVDVYINFSVNLIARTIFASNKVERAGLSLDETIRLCRRVFEGDDIDTADIDPDSVQYQRDLKFLVENNGIANPTKRHIVRARREVIQHAKAMAYIVDATLNRNGPFSEELILGTHRILCDGISLDASASSTDVNYAGVYRDTMALAGSTLFTSPENIAREMRIFIDDFSNDIDSRETTKCLDPFYLAADVCQDFVTIHPFKDGNGRMCRLIANAFLIKYAGIVIPIGENEEDRERYLNIAAEAGDGATEEAARAKLASYFLEKAATVLEGTLSALQLNNSST